MAGGLHGANGAGLPLSHRGEDASSYRAELDSQRPWEHPPTPPGPRRLPKDAHVEVHTLDGWMQGLLLELEREPHGWTCHVAYLQRDGAGGVTLLQAWVPAEQVRARPSQP